MKKLRFFKCKHCGNVVIRLVDKNVPVFCCGEMMQEISANTVDAATEKHVPVVSKKGKLITVNVGTVSHPMLDEHFINFIAIESERGYAVKTLNPGDKPEATFYIGDSKVVNVFEYCNLHGLWKAEI